MSTPLDRLRAVLCDPEGRVCIAGSDGDRAVIQSALNALTASPTREELAAALRELLAAFTKAAIAIDSAEPLSELWGLGAKERIRARILLARLEVKS